MSAVDLKPLVEALLRAADRPRLTVQRREAADMLGVSVETFRTRIQPELSVIRRGSVRLFRVAELERWVDENAAKTVDSE